MKSSTIGFALFHLASLCYGAPGSSYVKARQGIADTVTFQGAGPNPPSYTLTFPCDGTNVAITNPLSVSHIFDTSTVCFCYFYGVDGSVTSLTLGADAADVGPPQTLVSGNCNSFAFPHKARRTSVLLAFAVFEGAGPNPPTYSETFSANGVAQPITNPLSVSHISLSGVVTCTFFGVDGSVTEVSGGESVDVGPPQAQVSAVCKVRN